MRWTILSVFNFKREKICCCHRIGKVAQLIFECRQCIKRFFQFQELIYTKITLLKIGNQAKRKLNLFVKNPDVHNINPGFCNSINPSQIKPFGTILINRKDKFDYIFQPVATPNFVSVEIKC